MKLEALITAVILTLVLGASTTLTAQPSPRSVNGAAQSVRL